MKRFEEDLNKCIDLSCSWRELNFTKMSVLSSFTDGFSIIPIKILADYFLDINKLIPKIIGKSKRENNRHSIEKEQSQRSDTT